MLRNIALWLAAAAVIGGIVGVTALKELHFTVDGNRYDMKELISGEAMSKNLKTFEDTATIPNKDIEAIKADLVSENLEVVYEKRSDILVTLKGEATLGKSAVAPKLKTNVLGNRLSIGLENRNMSNFMNFVYNAKVTVSLPEAMKPTLDLNTVSGNISAEGYGDVSAKTVSGNALLVAKEGAKAEMKTTSGNLKLEGDASTVRMGSVSGDIDLNLSTLKGDLTSESTSGQCRMVIANPGEGFEFNGSSLSGNISIEGFGKDVVTEGDKLSTTVGGGKYQVKANSVSGDIEVRQK